MDKERKKHVVQYSPEYKAEAVSLVKKKKKPLNQIAFDLDIDKRTLIRWVQESYEAAEIGITAFSPYQKKIEKYYKLYKKESIDCNNYRSKYYDCQRELKETQRELRETQNHNTNLIRSKKKLINIIYIFLFCIGILSVFIAITKENIVVKIEGTSNKLKQNSVLSIIDKSNEKASVKNSKKEYRLVDHITNDLSPIFFEVEDKLTYTNFRTYIGRIVTVELANDMNKKQKTLSKNDQTDDGLIDCKDYAILFYKLASIAGFDVRIITNSKINHAFCAVRRTNGEWEMIEPQAGRNGYKIMKNAWGKEYDPAFDKDVTELYTKMYDIIVNYN
jgi:transposase-like protein